MTKEYNDKQNETDLLMILEKYFTTPIQSGNSSMQVLHSELANNKGAQNALLSANPEYILKKLSPIVQEKKQTKFQESVDATTNPERLHYITLTKEHIDFIQKSSAQRQFEGHLNSSELEKKHAKGKADNNPKKKKEEKKKPEKTRQQKKDEAWEKHKETKYNTNNDDMNSLIQILRTYATQKERNDIFSTLHTALLDNEGAQSALYNTDTAIIVKKLLLECPDKDQTYKVSEGMINIFKTKIESEARKTFEARNDPALTSDRKVYTGEKPNTELTEKELIYQTNKLFDALTIWEKGETLKNDRLATILATDPKTIKLFSDLTPGDIKLPNGKIVTFSKDMAQHIIYIAEKKMAPQNRNIGAQKLQKRTEGRPSINSR